MIQRRVREFWKSAIFLFKIALRDNFAISVVLMVSTIGVAVHDDSEPCDNIFQTGHLMSRNFVT